MVERLSSSYDKKIQKFVTNLNTEVTPHPLNLSVEVGSDFRSSEPKVNTELVTQQGLWNRIWRTEGAGDKKKNISLLK